VRALVAFDRIDEGRELRDVYEKAQVDMSVIYLEMFPVEESVKVIKEEGQDPDAAMHLPEIVKGESVVLVSETVLL
jgi:hypothetical protein